MTKSHTIRNTRNTVNTVNRRRNLAKAVLLGAVVFGSAGCYSTTYETQALEAEPIDVPVVAAPAIAADEVDSEPRVDIADLSHTDEGQNIYIDGFGAKRDAGTDEPICPTAPPADGLGEDGNPILFDGRFGLALCDSDGTFLTMVDEGPMVDEG